ncbi:MAG: Rhomboid protease GlpG, partial [Planctomycetota bacterium]
MRCLTTIEGKNQAEVFVAYLLTLDISTHVEPAQSESLAGAADAQGSPTDPSKQLWEVWVRNQDRMSLAQVALAEFQANPNDPKYAAALKQANSILKEK